MHIDVNHHEDFGGACARVSPEVVSSPAIEVGMELVVPQGSTESAVIVSLDELPGVKLGANAEVLNPGPVIQTAVALAEKIVFWMVIRVLAAAFPLVFSGPGLCFGPFQGPVHVLSIRLVFCNHDKGRTRRK